MISSDKRLLGVAVDNLSKNQILENIRKYIRGQEAKAKRQKEFLHVVSLNPENLVIAQKDDVFKKVVETAQIRIIDGIGVWLAARFMAIEVGERVAGVDLMEHLIKLADERRLKVVLIGGKQNLSERLADCYKQKYPNLKLIGMMGVVDIKNPTKEENERIYSIVADYKPHLVFISFGSPQQEIWLWRNRERFRGAVCMGVGGAFGFLSGSVMRAPRIVRRVGLEWFFRLISQPWRWRRQLRLIEFIGLVLKQKWSRKS